MTTNRPTPMIKTPFFCLLLLVAMPLEVALGAGSWPGVNNGGSRRNSSDANVGPNLQLQWTYVMDPQNVNTSKTPNGVHNGSVSIEEPSGTGRPHCTASSRCRVSGFRLSRSQWQGD